MFSQMSHLCWRKQATHTSLRAHAFGHANVGGRCVCAALSCAQRTMASGRRSLPMELDKHPSLSSVDRGGDSGPSSDVPHHPAKRRSLENTRRSPVTATHQPKQDGQVNVGESTEQRATGSEGTPTPTRTLTQTVVVADGDNDVREPPSTSAGPSPTSATAPGLPASSVPSPTAAGSGSGQERLQRSPLLTTHDLTATPPFVTTSYCSDQH